MLKGDGDAEELAEKLAKAQEEKTHLEQQIKDQGLIIADLEGQVKLLKKFELFDKALTGLIEAKLPAINIPQGNVASEVQLESTTTIVDVPAVAKSVRINDSTVPGKILTVARKGLLDKWTRLGDIVKAIIEEGWTVSPQQVNNALNDMVKQQLIAKKHTDRNYFKLAKNVVFKKEVEA